MIDVQSLLPVTTCSEHSLQSENTLGSSSAKRFNITVLDLLRYELVSPAVSKPTYAFSTSCISRMFTASRMLRT